jgi:hypothetical protein
MPMRRVFQLLVGASLGASPLTAQDTQELRIGHVFLERTYFAPGAPMGKGYLFDGEAALHLYYWNGLDQGWLGSGEGFRSRWSISFMPVARMKDGASEPVRTPSFKIRPLLLQVVNLTPTTRDRRWFWLHAGSVGVTHYSNGQEGCFFRGYARDDASGACVVDDAPLAAQELTNERTGDFSSTYFPLRYDVRFGRIDAATEAIVESYTVGGEFQLDMWDDFTGGMDRTLAREYGRHQMSLWVEGEWAMSALGEGYGRVTADVAHRFPWRGGADLTTGSVEVAYIWKRFNHAGIFGRVRWGADDYNIRFRRQGPFLHAGFVFDPDAIRFLKAYTANPGG